VTIGAPCRSAIAFVFDHHIEGAVFAAMAAKNAFEVERCRPKPIRDIHNFGGSDEKENGG
jgi:hypothetical protein